MGTPALSRRLKARLAEVYQAIRTDDHPNANTLARRFEVTPRTVKRDIETLRDHFNVAIEYHPVHHGYYLLHPEKGFPDGPFSEAEIFAVFVARQFLAAHRGTAIEQILSEGFHRLELRLDGEQRYYLGDLAQLISFRPPAPEELGAELFRQLTDALRRRREVRFLYQGLKDPKPRLRRVRGYHLGCIDLKWYLFGWDTGRRDIRTFALCRMTDLETTARPFNPPSDFDIAQYLNGSFGVHSGNGANPTRVEIRFKDWAARLVRERTWHHTQQLIDTDHGLHLVLHLNGLDEIHRWILSWGDHAEVLHPPELCARIAGITARMTALHHPLTP
jgi:predicted DNA-binding transcriptional regulator YafY